MSEGYPELLIKAKEAHRKKIAKLPFEKKVEIIIELQKIDIEMSKHKSKLANKRYKKVWQISEKE